MKSKKYRSAGAKGAKNMNSEIYIRNRLFELRDEKYRDFHASLCPTVDKQKIIGVRKPAVRSLAKELFKQNTDMTDEFLKTLPHEYCEENDLHGMLIGLFPDYGRVIYELDGFLPFVDNWATCDLISPRVFKKRPEGLDKKAGEWAENEKTYTCRFGIEILMKYYLDDGFDLKYPRLVAKIRSDEYYVKMMIAWYFSTALAKQWDAVIPFIEQKRLDLFEHNKAIQKAIESYRITEEQKDHLRTLRIKTK